jgi:hypothetical protein
MRPRLAFVLLFSALSAVGRQRAAAAGAADTTSGAPVDRPLVHPIYAQLPDLAENEVTRRTFAAAATRYKLQPLEVIDIPAPAPPKAPSTLRATIVKVAAKLAFDEALPELDADAKEVAETGGAGLTTIDLADLFLYRAMATARADWKATAAPEAATLNAARARAFDDYVRAATLAPDRKLNARELPPQVVADFGRAVAEARKLPRATLVVSGDADAQVSLDGAPATAVGGGVTFRDVAYGEHVISIDELGRAPWGTRLVLTTAKVEQVIPARPALGLDDAVAADHARRMGARFALVAERKPGPGARVELRLVDLKGTKRDAALISTTGDEHGTIDASVMRLDEEARRIVQLELGAGTTPPPVDLGAAPPGSPAPVLMAPPRHQATFQEDPAAWARDRWPLLTAMGVLVGSAIALSIAAH